MTAINGFSNIPVGLNTAANGAATGAINAIDPATDPNIAMTNLLTGLLGPLQEAVPNPAFKVLAHLFQPNPTDSVPPVKVRKPSDDDYYSALGYTS